MKPIDKNTINEFENLTRSDSHVRSIRNATFRNNLIEVAMDWDHYRKIDHSFSDVINGEMPRSSRGFSTEGSASWGTPWPPFWWGLIGWNAMGKMKQVISEGRSGP